MSDMRPLRFGAGGELVGLHHAPGNRPNRGAVLLCAPPGPEAPGLHRTLRVLADRLARVGFHVLRFDYYATGDSLGETGEASIVRWQRDVCSAHTELEQLSGAERVYWIGFRLGATIAAHAARTLPGPLHCLALWDPVVEGRAYLDELLRVHAALLGAGKNMRGSASAAGPTMEALGLPMSAPFIVELHGLNLGPACLRGAERVIAFCPADSRELARAGTDLAVRIEFEEVADSTWPGAEAFESTVLRTDIVTAVMSKVIAA